MTKKFIKNQPRSNKEPIQKQEKDFPLKNCSTHKTKTQTKQTNPATKPNQTNNQTNNSNKLKPNQLKPNQTNST